MDWMLIITLLLEAIMESLEDRNPAVIAGRLKKPRGREVLIFRRMLVKEFGLNGRELRDACKEGIEELKSMPGSEVDALIADAVAMRAERRSSE